MIRYFANNRLGALLYNLGHSRIVPIALMSFVLLCKHETAMAFSFIWLADIGPGKCLGYGLKLISGLNETHLGNNQ